MNFINHYVSRQNMKQKITEARVEGFILGFCACIALVLILGGLK